MFTAFLFALMMHPVHETVAEVDWNAETQRLEVSLRFDALDEQWLRKRYAGEQESSSSPRQPRPSGSETDAKKGDAETKEDWTLAYLRQSFRVTEKPKRQLEDSTTYHWIGRKEEGSDVWWYFELQPSDGQRPKWIENRILFEKDDQHVNRVLALDTSPRQSLVLNRKQPRSSLNQSSDESKRKTTTDR